MSALLESLLTALCLSALAVCCLVFLPRTPPRVRFAIAAAGLAAWVVPWGAIRIAVPASNPAVAPLVEWLDAGAAAAPLAAERLLDVRAALGYAVAAAFLVGIVLLTLDWLALQRCLRGWRARSRPADELRALLPRELAAVAADIRLVEGSGVAAASGVLRPTIWLGDRHTDAHRTLALVHEAWHVRAHDPAWLLGVAAVRRAYWWNPLVAYLARQAVLMIESTCDHRCAVQFGKADYVARLAALLLSSTASAPRLVATIGAASLDVQRLRLLGQTLRLRARDLLLIGALGAAGTATATVAVVDRVAIVARSPASAAAQPVGRALPSTPAGDALGTLLRAANGGDSELLAELLGAYTPQELSLPLPHAPNVRIVDVLRSEPLRIEYIVESATGSQHAGELTVSAAATPAITATRLQPLP